MIKIDNYQLGSTNDHYINLTIYLLQLVNNSNMLLWSELIGQ